MSSFNEFMNQELTLKQQGNCISLAFQYCYPHKSSYLHHEYHSVESDHDHDGVLEWSWDHKLPHSVLEWLCVLRHVACQRFCIYGKVDTSPLYQKKTHMCFTVFIIWQKQLSNPNTERTEAVIYYWSFRIHTCVSSWQTKLEKTSAQF